MPMLTNTPCFSERGIVPLWKPTTFHLSFLSFKKIGDPLSPSTILRFARRGNDCPLPLAFAVTFSCCNLNFTMINVSISAFGSMGYPNKNNSWSPAWQKSFSKGKKDVSSLLWTNWRRAKLVSLPYETKREEMLLIIPNPLLAGM